MKNNKINIMFTQSSHTVNKIIGIKIDNQFLIFNPVNLIWKTAAEMTLVDWQQIKNNR